MNELLNCGNIPPGFCADFQKLSLPLMRHTVDPRADYTDEPGSISPRLVGTRDPRFSPDPPPPPQSRRRASPPPRLPLLCLESATASQCSLLAESLASLALQG